LGPNGRCGTDSGEKAPFLTEGVKKVRKWGFRGKARKAASRGSRFTIFNLNLYWTQPQDKKVYKFKKAGSKIVKIP
jgi:hypothetical protein